MVRMLFCAVVLGVVGCGQKPEPTRPDAAFRSGMREFIAEARTLCRLMEIPNVSTFRTQLAVVQAAWARIPAGPTAELEALREQARLIAGSDFPEAGKALADVSSMGGFTKETEPMYRAMVKASAEVLDSLEASVRRAK